MKYLIVLYDARCSFCVRSKLWLSRQPQFIKLRLIPATVENAKLYAGDIAADDWQGKLLLISDTGDLYKDENAFIMCLYALRHYRSLAMRFADPALNPLAGRLYKLLAGNRYRLSHWLGVDDRTMARELRRLHPPHCDIPDTDSS